ncbi:hypothetical protein SO694_001010109 [Aureococcus anophagefferens]|uniref:Transcription initiation factor TFIID subunit 12 domain-containing protein n=1 Tax=Aureococcus anophagefferens TaxID=44056 RepID=A0ABR1FN10_AURAN
MAPSKGKTLKKLEATVKKRVELDKAREDLPNRDGALEGEVYGARLGALLKEVDPAYALEPEAEELVLKMADEFVHQVTKGRGIRSGTARSGTLGAVDVQLCLEKHWDIVVPGIPARTAPRPAALAAPYTYRPARAACQRPRIITTRYAAAKRGKPFSTINAAANLASCAVPLVVTRAVARFGFRALFLAVGGVCALLPLVQYASIAEGDVAAPAAAAAPAPGLGGVLRSLGRLAAGAVLNVLTTRAEVDARSCGKADAVTNALAECGGAVAGLPLIALVQRARAGPPTPGRSPSPPRRSSRRTSPSPPSAAGARPKFNPATGGLAVRGRRAVGGPRGGGDVERRRDAA